MLVKRMTWNFDMPGKGEFDIFHGVLGLFDHYIPNYRSIDLTHALQRKVIAGLYRESP